MRVTNLMMTSNALNNINKNKIAMSKLDEQNATGNKIQRPSDDPIVAVRSLKLRTSLSEIEQYLEKNIPDAMSWMELTASSLDTISGVLESMNSYCEQGATGTTVVKDRDAIAKTLENMRLNIYQEGNANNAGRYLFTGFKTDSSLIFTDKVNSQAYTDIVQKFSGSNIKMISKVINGYEMSDYNDTTGTIAGTASRAEMVDSYCIQLAYGEIKPFATQADLDAAITYTDNTVNPSTVKSIGTLATPPGITPTTSTAKDAYDVGDNEVKFISDTGELIFGKNINEKLRTQGPGEINITYDKTEFKQYEPRPEHYFDCRTTVNGKIVNYTKKPQDIEYEINFDQKIKINVEGSDAITHEIGRIMDTILNAVSDVEKVDEKLVEVDKLLSRTDNTPAKKETLQKLKKDLETEKALRDKVLHNAFEEGMAVSQSVQSKVGFANADLGSRINRVEWTESRMEEQKINMKELQTTNDKVNIVDAYIMLTSAQAIYNNSLSSASKIVKNSLLDFI